MWQDFFCNEYVSCSLYLASLSSSKLEARSLIAPASCRSSVEVSVTGRVSLEQGSFGEEKGQENLAAIHCKWYVGPVRGGLAPCLLPHPSKSLQGEWILVPNFHASARSGAHTPCGREKAEAPESSGTMQRDPAHVRGGHTRWQWRGGAP